MEHVNAASIDAACSKLDPHANERILEAGLGNGGHVASVLTHAQPEVPCDRTSTSSFKERTSMTGADLASILPHMLPRLWTFALRISGDRHDAEDLVQRACVRALERAHQLQADTIPLSWMFSIVQSTWINELRARNVRRRWALDWYDEFLEMIPDPKARTPEQHVLDSQIVSAVQRLPEAQRVVMLLVGLEGLSYSEAAEVLNVPIGTIMSRLSRARQAIGALFRDEKQVCQQMAAGRKDHR
jgi:RNA polymerase sigma-70 factor (ECF subfamily)